MHVCICTRENLYKRWECGYTHSYPRQSRRKARLGTLHGVTRDETTAAGDSNFAAEFLTNLGNPFMSVVKARIVGELLRGKIL